MPQEPKALLVEGKDEVNFFEALLKQLGITGVAVQEIGGKDKFPNELPAFLLSFGEQIVAYAVVRDADRNADSTFQSVIDLLKKQGEPFPARAGAYAATGGRRVGVYIMPGNQEEGMLEDLCMQTVADHPVMDCVDRYFSCLSERLAPFVPVENRIQGRHYFPRNPSKARALAFLAGLDNAHSSVGIAAKKGCWNFDHPSLIKLKEFLVGL